MEKKELSDKESFDIIMKMIDQAKVNFSQSSFHLLLWGWIISIASFTHYILMVATDIKRPDYVWLVVVPGILISMIYGYRIGKKARISTYADRLYFLTWIGFILVMIILNIFMREHGTLLASTILLLTGYAVFMSGNIIKFTPLIAGGFLIWIGAIVAFIVNNEVILLITGISVLVGYLIPGYMLRNKVKDVTF